MSEDIDFQGDGYLELTEELNALDRGGESAGGDAHGAGDAGVDVAAGLDDWDENWKIFPCRAKSSPEVDKDGYSLYPAKKPLIPWKDPAVWSNDPIQLEKWAGQFPGYMQALPTGEINGIWVLDLDIHYDFCVDEADREAHTKALKQCFLEQRSFVPKKLTKEDVEFFSRYCLEHGLETPEVKIEDGIENFKRYCSEHGHEFPKTLTVITPSGGLHLYFIMPIDGTDIRNSAGEILPGVDVRGTGGYVIKPPSMNQDIGKAYEWEDPSGSIAVAEQWLVALVTKKKKPAPSANVAQVAGRVPEGQRNDTLASLAGTWITVKKLSFDECLCMADGWNRNFAKPPLPLSEVEHTVRSVFETHKRNHPGAADDGPKPGEEGFEWDEPVLLTDAELPQITRDMLPPVLGDYCAELAEEVQVPFELCVSMVIAVVATAAALSYRVHVRQNHFECLCLYTLCILNASNRKSAVVKAAMKPLIEWEDNQREKLAPEIKRRNRIRKALSRRIEQKNAEYAKCKNEDRQKILDEIRDLEDEMLPELRVPTLWTDSPTPEALSVLIEEQNERMALLSDEAGVFEILAGMYSKGIPNLDLFLKGCFGMPCRIPRKTGTVILKEPLLTVGLTAQEVILTRRSASEVFRGRGGDCRFLYFYPASNMGERNVRDPKPMSEETRAAYYNVVYRLLPSEWWADGERPEPIDLELSEKAHEQSPGALEQWIQFSEGVEEALRPGGEFEFMQDWGGKIAGFVVRLAGLFHLVSSDRPWEMKIAPETMEKAVRMGAALSRHAKKAYDLMGADEATNGAKKVLEWIERTGSSRFTFREVWQGTKGFFRHVDKLIPALKELGERFYIYELPSGGRTGAGRPARPNYLVNPKALKG